MTIDILKTILVAVVVSFALLIKFAAAADETHDECDSQQYLYINESEIIQCSFENYVAITWYNAEVGKTILLLNEGDKSGDGYRSGEYDIFPNGSLLIQNVTVEHEALFKVIKVISVEGALSLEYDIRIRTLVKPHTSYPVIDKCQEGNTFCLISVYSDGSINCVIENSRPSVNLTWISRSLQGDQLLDSSYTSNTNDNITYTSNSTVEYVMSQLSLLNTFVCQADSSPRDLIAHQESVIVLDKVINYEDVTPAPKIHVEVQSSMKLPCYKNGSNNNNRKIIVWKQLLKGHDTWSTILFTTTSSKSLTESYRPEFQVDGDGTLLLETLQTHQEGLYICIFKSGQKEDVILYNVTTYVHPSPSYPVVEGCEHQKHCVLHVANDDGIKCSIIGIRPEVELEWIIFGDTDTVSFEDKRYSVKQNKDLFDVTLTSIIAYSTSSEKTVTVACKVTPSESHPFHLSTTIDIHLSTTIDIQLIATPTKQQDVGKTIMIVAVIAVCFAAIITIVLLIRKKVRGQQSREQRRREQQTWEADQEELSPMMHDMPEKGQATSDRNNEEVFIDHLKAKYEILYDFVQPIPYIKDRMYCVDKVFVESGIEYLLKSADARQKGNWRPLKSYHELLGENLTTFDRSILEGEPGYGKSTITLQLAYDWCNSVRESPLSSIKMLLYLRLRQLGGVSSIYQAIKRFILPKDSTLTEEDIKQVVEACNSVVIVLDGYDEYPDQDNKETDISKIIAKDIFRKTKVILTTRSSYLPKHRVAQYSRVRLLGFDESARDKYIRKAVVGDDEVAVENIKHKLQENPVLGDLCEVPLFFVMFAHITHENKALQTFKSVTEFFRYMITCFHSHMRNKLEDENVKEFQFMETEHSRLDEIAFKALTGNHQQIVWRREELVNSLGITFYDQYVKVGILVEDDIVSGILNFNSKSYSTVEVRFYHKLFCEWYAAHYLAQCISKGNMNTSHLLANIDPYDLQYLFRFACGISKDASEEIIKYLRKTEEGKKFAMLCILEQEGETIGLLESVTDLVSEEVTLSGNDSRLLRRSTLQILDFASKKDIPIKCVSLHQSFDKVDDDVIVLTSGFVLPKLSTLGKIHIETGKEKELTENEVIKVLKYVRGSRMMKEISFGECLLPLSFSVSHEITKGDIKVYWRPFDCDFLPNFQSGQWEVDDINYVRDLCCQTIYIKEKQSKLEQRSIIQLLNIASNHNILINCVSLHQSFKIVDNDVIVLTSGLMLPKLSTLGKIHIEAGEERELTENEVIKVLKYARGSRMIKEISFGECLLPLSFPVFHEITNRDIKVTWCRYGYRFNSQSRLWEVDDVDTVRRLCSSSVVIQRTDSKLLQEWTIQLLKNASDNVINVPCLVLEQCVGTFQNTTISLLSGVNMPPLHAVEKILVNTGERQVESGLIVGLAQYGEQCSSLTEIRFHKTSVLPLSIDTTDVPPDLKSSHVPVYWQPFDCDFRANIQSGQWEVDDIDYVRDLCSSVVSLKKGQNKLEQRSIIQLLKTASNHNIPITQVWLQECSPRVNKYDLSISLDSGLSLPILNSLQILWIHDVDRTLTNDEFVDFLRYSSECTSLNELWFWWGYTLPETVPPRLIPYPLIDRNVQVIYTKRNYSDFILNFETGRWEPWK